jgi:6-pyruvoyltetrahydropterin/6-carboxytetrahydropterin synthase
VTERIVYTASASFESARRLATAPSGGGLHGHSFLSTVGARAPGTGLPAWAPFPGGEADALREQLLACIAPLDYQLLNDHLDVPSDENLARWIGARLKQRGMQDDIERLGVHSTRERGVDIDALGVHQVWRRYEFESAHRLPRVAPGHKCGRMHGHGFAVVLHAQAADPRSLDAVWAPLQRQLHHACLNDIAGLENPTSELLASWIWACVRPALPGLRCVTVFETATCGAHFDGAHYRIWKELGLESAVRLTRAPAGDGRGRIHGHSYRLRLHLSAALDTVLGWTIDFGDVKEIFAPVFELLDHQPLHELPGVAEAGALGIARWVRARAAAALPQLERIDLLETPGCGVILSWGPEHPALPV